METLIGLAYAVLALLSFSFSPLLYKMGLKNLETIVANTVRVIGTLVLLTPIHVFYFGFRAHFPLNFTPILLLLITSLSGPLVGDILYMVAIRRVGVSIAVPLANSYALIVTMVSIIFFNEKFTLLNVIGATLIILSIWILYMEKKSSSKYSIIGFLAALGAALGFSTSIITMNIMLKSIDPTIIIYFRTLVVMLIQSAILRSLNKTLPRESKTWIFLSLGGFLGTGLGVILFLKAMSILGAGKASFIASSSPVVSTLSATLLLREKFRVRAILAASLVTLGVILLR